MTTGYDRFLSKTALATLLPGGAFRFLVTDMPRLADDPYGLDLQLRRDNTLMYYRGTTRLLTIRICERGGLRAVAGADKAYGRYALCRNEYEKMMRTWMLGDTYDMGMAFRAYLAKAMAACNSKYYSNKKEGYWQNQLCIDWGYQWRTGMPWLVIDRECVIGFEGRDKQREYYDGILQPYADLRACMQKEAPEIWGRSKEKAFGDELDLLAVDGKGDLVVIELKHGSSASGIYWGPMQLYAYRDVFRDKLAEISPGLKELVRQKVALGLLPEDALARLPQDDFVFGGAMLGIGDPNLQSSCWEKVGLVATRLGASMSIEDKGALRLITFS